MADEYIKILFDDMVYKSPDYETIGVTNNSLAEGLDAWLDKLSSDLDDLDIDHKGNIHLILKSSTHEAISSGYFTRISG